MKKIGIKKLLLYISILPYIYCIIMSIYHTIFGYSYNSIYIDDDYGIEGMMAFLGEAWDSLYGSVIALILVGACIIYQIYYFMNFRINKGKKDKKTKINIKKILFVVSVICWLMYFMLGVYAFFFGINDGLFSDNFVYGIEALKVSLTWNLLIFTYIPVLPISTIYICIYLLMKYKEKGKNVGKLFFYISLLPYMYIVFMSIYSFAFGYEYFENRPEYGIKGTIDFIDDFLWENFVEFNFIGGVVIASLVYQIYYLFRFKLIKNTANNKLEKNRRTLVK